VEGVTGSTNQNIRSLDTDLKHRTLQIYKDRQGSVLTEKKNYISTRMCVTSSRRVSVSKISSKRGVRAIVLALLSKMCLLAMRNIETLNSQCRRDGTDFRFKEEDEDVILNLNLQAVVQTP
jgi:hypothetical protein